MSFTRLAFQLHAAAFLVLLSFQTNAQSTDSFGPAAGFNAFVEANFESQYTDVEGRLAAGGNIVLGSYGVASKIGVSPETHVLIAGQNITYNNGMIFSGSVLAGGSAALIANNVRNGMAVGSSITDNAQLPFDFASEFIRLRDIAATLAQADVTGNVVYQWGGVKLTGDCSADPKVFLIDGAQLKTASSLSLECVPADATLIFNVSGANPGMQNIGLAHLQSRANKILWNFYEAQTVSFSSIGVEGSILAPHASLNTPWGYVNGTVMVKNWTGHMELHHVPFTGDISSLLSSEAPVIITEPNVLGYENTPYEYDVDAIDEDVGDVLTHSIDLAPPGFAINPSSGLISWEPASAYVGSVEEFNSQCYVVPTGGVTIVEEGDELPDGRVAIISPLFKRVKEALEISAEYTARESVAWDQRNGCLGCHIQTQSLLGLETSIEKVEVDELAVDYLINRLFDNQQANGTIVSTSHTTTYLNNQTSLALWSLSSYPDRTLTFDARSKALSFFLTRPQTSGTQNYWGHDHPTGWMNNAYAVTALVTQAGARILEDTLDPNITFTETNYATAQGFRALVPNLVEFFLAAHDAPVTDVTQSAFRLIGLSELRPFVSDGTTLSRIDNAIEFLDQYLRSTELEEGGWAFRTGQTIGSPVASAWVGIALNYLDPDLSDPVIIRNIEFLLSVQDLASGASYGTWRDASFFPGPNLAATSLVMSYLPIALDFLGNPDLHMAQLSLVEQGDLLQIQATVTNRGIKDVTGESRVRFYAGGDVEAPYLGETTVPPIASGTSANISFAVDDPALIGTDIFAEVIVAEDVLECEIRNNKLRSAVVRHRVTDRRGLFDTQLYALSIKDQNSAPVITSPAKFTHQQAQLKSLKVTIADADIGDAAFFELEGAPIGVYINDRTGEILVDGEVIEPGDYSFVVKVTDLRGATAEQQITFTINQNLPPQIVSMPVAQKQQGDVYSYDVEAVDPNGDVLRYGMDSATGFSIRNNTGEILSETNFPLESLRTKNEYCETQPIAPDEFDVEQMWNWLGDGANSAIFGPPMVAQLTDDNGDDIINYLDTPDIIFNSEYQSKLVAISGDTGQMIWTNTTVSVARLGSPSIADINGDGLVEIVTVSQGRSQIHAFDHTGQLLWSKPTEAPAFADPRDSISIADLDADGIPELILGRNIYDNNGNLLAQGTGTWGGDTQYGIVSIAADIDLDGYQEVIAGRTVYDHQGAIVWQNTQLPTTGFNAVGNFDDDDFPEIVLVGKGRVYLLQSDGTIIWNFAIPGGGDGGAPTIADMDGDGLLEIGVAGAANYVVYNHDGSIHWQFPTQDTSSHRTGSSVFDFQGDGRAEVVYADETNLRIWDGRTGNVLFEVSNLSGTTLEYPVIADINNDGAAEIIYGGNSGSTRGLYALKSAGAPWAPTRSIWNQHSYHITNINDDGTVPQNEQPSWLSHNTYRLNTFSDKPALSAPDLAAFELKYDESTQTLSTLILNRGLAQSNASGTVTFYSGNPDDGGVALGSRQVGPLSASGEQRISIPGISAELLAADVFVEVEYEGSAEECITTNNRTYAKRITVMATDDGGLTDSQTYLFSVINRNDFPRIVNPVASTINAGAAFELAVQVDDPDVGDAHRFALADSSSVFSINGKTGVVSASAGNLPVGLHSFRVVATDLSGASAEQTHVVTVAEPDNLPPVFVSVPPAQATVLNSLFYTAAANDPDGDEVVFLLKEFPAGAVLDGVTGELSWAPRREQAGLQIFDITALDTNGATSNQRFAVEVVDPQANNHPPQITSRPSGLVVAGKVFDYQVIAVDPDGDSLSYSLRSPTGNMAITSAGHFSWLPDINSVGRIYTVEIVVKDSLGAEAIQTLALPVNEPSNTPPQITSTPGTSVLVAQQYRYQLVATDSDGDPIRFELGTQKPNGMTIDSAGLVQWTPATQQVGQIFEVEVRAVDSRGAISTQSFSIAVNIAAEPNELPFFVSVPTSPALVGETYVYQAQAEDLDKDSLTYELASSALVGLQLSGEGLLAWTPTIEQVGEYNIAIKVSDGKGAVTQSYMLEVREPGDLSNGYPVISSTPEAEAIVGKLYSYQLIATDPDGDTLNFEMLSELGDGMSFSNAGLLQWAPTIEDVGIRNFLVKVSDGQLARTQSWSVKVWDGVPPLRVFLNVDPAVANEGDVISLSVAKTGGVSDASLALFVDGDEIALDSMGNASVVAAGFGLHQVRAVATSGGESVEETTQYLVRNTADVVPPVAVITTPENDDILTESVAIIGTASDANLVAYELYLAPVGSDDWALINSGNTSVTDGELGTLDPTLMVNGQYTLQLQVTDINGQIAADTKVVALDGDLKVGNFSFTVKDLSVPMVGIPIEVSRTYDSRRRTENLDFGYGWSVDYQNVKVGESRIPGRFWDDVQVRRGPFGLIADFCVEPLGAPVVTVTLPTGKVERFEASASPRCTTYNLIRDVELVFNPVGDTLSKLVPLDDRYGYYMNGQIVENGYYSAPLNPNRYKLTTQAGYEYILNQAFGIEKVIDPNGHTLTYTNEGIFHSSGKAVTFGRDSQGRITDVIAPNGSRLTYHYDGRDDLEMVVDRDESQTRYTYNNSHGLLDILDPLNRPVLKNLYDEQSRLYAQEDGNGVIKSFDHDLDAKTSLVTDRDGRSTLFEYDEEGLIASETILIADGSYEQDIITSYGYDANGNQETRTIGDSVWRADFDARNNQLFAKDPEGHTVFYRDHNDRGQEGEVEDEMGRISKMTYDSAGNLYLVEMPEVVDLETGETEIPTAGNTINARGLVSKTVDLSGLETTYTYYPKGHQWEDQKKTEANSVIGTITYTYDGNNNVKTETRDRTVDGVVTQEAVIYDYDARDRLTKTTYSDGTYSETVYDLAGNTDKERDRLGVWTDYEYDAYGRLVQTDYADGTSEIRTYTAEGLLETITDRSGYVTRNEYDGAGRLWKVHNEQDGSFTETRYTLQGWVQYEWDEKRNRTEHRYDKAGRRTHTIRVDDAGDELVWGFEYYPNGELHKETDPLNHATEYVINELDQRIATLYHNGTSLEERYDLMGRRTATIDQNLRRTAFGYDDLGRLTGVTPEVSINGEPVPETIYSYDEVGNKLSQTDANGHTTRWTYDYHGRVLSRTLPEGMSESFEYVDAERKVIHTDFNGDTITTLQDEMGRMQRMEYSKDGAVESFTYWPNHQVKTATTAEGTTEYFYDPRHRLDYELRPDGARMDYDYDLVGNRTLVKVTRAGTVTSQMSYTYDALNRLETATNDLAPGETTDYTYDAAGNLDTVTYPNGLVTDYDYNSINQLTDVYTRDSSGTLISHYAYRLDNTGRRTVVTELSGRTTAYCHDELYRLKAETVFDTATALTEGCLTPAQRTGASYTADYQYDWTGNRTYETVDGVQTAYSYDDNDRLLQTGGTVYGYDDNGNTLSTTLDGDTTTYQYNGKNQLISTTKAGITSTYTYNPNGIRNGKTEGGITTRFIVDENRDYAQVLEEITNGTITTAYSYGHDLISQDKNGATSFYHYDGLGSTRALSDTIGALTDTYDYEAFGELLNQTGSTENSYLFTGEQFDAGLNQYYLRARYYNQQIGRFTQLDTWMGNNQDPISLHKYLYAASDPVTYVDPTGNFGLAEFGASYNVMGALKATATVVGGSALLSAIMVLSEDDHYRADDNVTPLDISIAKVKARTCVLNGNDKCGLGIPTVVFGSDMWDATNHYWEAQTMMGLPQVLNRGTGFNRGWYTRLSVRECLGRGASQQCDEYPFNSTTQGGPENYGFGRVSLKLVNGIHNGAAGTLLNSMFSACGVSAGPETDSAFAAIPVPGGQSSFFCPGQ
jgi:choice-of-anchor A domain-containing protein/RHS repeat-associated protein